MDDASKPTIDDLIAWGLDYELFLKEPIPPGGRKGISIPLDLLNYYIAAANAALLQQREQERKKPRSRGGRPPGGMGEMKMRLEAAGVRPEDADRITMHAHGKSTIEPVHRAYDAVRKKLGTEPSRPQKTPTSSRTVRKKPPR